MDQTDPAAVGIGAEADVKHLSYLPAQCAGDHTLATCRAARGMFVNPHQVKCQTWENNA